MKKLFLVMLVVCMACSTYALLNIQWGANYAFENEFLKSSGESSDSILWGLVWASTDTLALSDLVYDEVANTLSVSGSTTIGTDVLQYRTIDSATGETSLADGTSIGTVDEYMGAQGLTDTLFSGSSYVDGYVYQVVYFYDTSDGLVYYYIGNAFGVSDANATQPPTTTTIWLETSSETMPGQNTVDWQDSYIAPSTVPEPTTMALLGIGGLALALRRKLRK